MKNRMSGMDLHALEAFHLVLLKGGFSRAAKAMGLKQPTVSQHVAALEAALGARLLDRRGRSARPTAAGRMLDGYAAKLLRLREEAVAAVERSSEDVRGTLVVAASTIPGTYLLPGAIRSLHEIHPKVCVEVRIGDSLEAEGVVAREEAELGATGAPPSLHGVEGRSFWKDELVLVFQPGAPFAPRRALMPRDLRALPFVLRERGSGTLSALHRALDEAGLDEECLKVAARTGSTEAVLEAVRQGAGASFVSKTAAARDLAAGSLASVAVRGLRIVRDCWVIVRKGRTLSPAAGAFRDMLLGARGLRRVRGAARLPGRASPS